MGFFDNLFGRKKVVKDGYQQLLDEEEVDPNKAEITEILTFLDKEYSSKSGAFTAEAKGEAKVSATLEKASEGIRRLVELKVLAEASLDFTAEYKGKYGKLGASLKGYAGIKGQCKADFMNLKAGVLLDVSASVSASASVNARIDAESKVFGSDKLGVQFSAYAEAYAKAEAEASGQILISKDGIAIKGSAKAGASVGAAVGFAGEAIVKNKKVFAIKGALQASVGAEASIGGGFEFKNGVLTINIKASAVAVVGGSADLTLTVDMDAIKELIAEELSAVGEKLKKRLEDYLEQLHAALVKNIPEDEMPLLGFRLDEDNSSAWESFKANILDKKYKSSKAKLVDAVGIAIKLIKGKPKSGL